MNLTPIWLRHFKHFSYVSYSKLSHSFRIFLRKISMKINGIKSLSLSFERLFGSISTDHWRSNCESTELHRKYASIFLISTSFLCVCYIHVCYLIPLIHYTNCFFWNNNSAIDHSYLLVMAVTKNRNLLSKWWHLFK